MGELRVDRAQVLAFRAAAHSLDRRRPPAQLLHVAGACGVQDTPPGNADVSLAARLDVDGPVAKAAVEGRELLLTWSVRGAPHLFPARDFAVFTTGACPAEGTRQKLWGEPEEALVEVEAAIVSVLGAQARPKGDVSAEVTGSLRPELTPWCGACKANHPRESVFRATPLLGRIVLTSNLDALAGPPAPVGVRLLPAKDGFLQARDRDLLFPDPAHRKAVFPVIGGPGVVLREARPVAIWRGAAKGASYEVAVTPFERLPAAVWAEIETEADRLARVRVRRASAVVRVPVP